MVCQRISGIKIRIPKESLLKRIGVNGKQRRISKRLNAAMEKAAEAICAQADAEAIFKVVLVNRNNGSVYLDDGPSLKSKRVAYVLKHCDKAVA